IPFQPRTWPTNGEWRFVQACRLIEKKGLPTSLGAFAVFARRHPAAQFTIPGDGPLLEPMQNLSRELGIADRVTFTGFISQNELRDLYYRSHTFLHPSETGPDGNQEGVPNSMLEAMASGLPVFATEHAGIPDAIKHGVSGVLVPERDDQELAWALLNAIEDRHFLSQLARNGT